MRSRLAALAVALLLTIPAAALAQDPDPTPVPSLCGPAVTGPGDSIDLTGDTPQADSGECAIITVDNQPAGRWLDATISVACAAPTGAGTSAVKDGWYLYGRTYDAGGALVGQGIVGSAWSGTGCGSGNTRTYHMQLVLQGYHRTIALVVERRAWPFSGTKVVASNAGHGYVAGVWVH